MDKFEMIQKARTHQEVLLAEKQTAIRNLAALHGVTPEIAEAYFQREFTLASLKVNDIISSKDVFYVDQEKKTLKESTKKSLALAFNLLIASGRTLENGENYFVPYSDKIIFMKGAKGNYQEIIASPVLEQFNTEPVVVWEGDKFNMVEFPRIEIRQFQSNESEHRTKKVTVNRTEWVDRQKRTKQVEIEYPILKGVFWVAFLKDGTQRHFYLPASKIEEYRAKSSAPDGEFWCGGVHNTCEMYKKTLINYVYNKHFRKRNVLESQYESQSEIFNKESHYAETEEASFTVEPESPNNTAQQEPTPQAQAPQTPPPPPTKTPKETLQSISVKSAGKTSGRIASLLLSEFEESAYGEYVELLRKISSPEEAEQLLSKVENIVASRKVKAEQTPKQEGGIDDSDLPF